MAAYLWWARAEASAVWIRGMGPVRSGGNWKVILQNIWASLLHNTANTPCYWFSPMCIKLSLQRMKRLQQTRWELAWSSSRLARTFQQTLVIPLSLKELKANKKNLVQRGTNSYTLEKAFTAFAVARKFCSLVSLWVPGASAFLSELYLGAKTPQKIISIYEVFFQVKAVKLKASANHFYSKVRIPIAKTVCLSVKLPSFGGVIWCWEERQTITAISSCSASIFMLFSAFWWQRQYLHMHTNHITCLTSARTAAIKTTTIFCWHFEHLIIRKKKK